LRGRSLVSVRRSFRLPALLACSDGDTEGDVVEARQSSPDNHVSRWRIVVAGEVAAEHGDLEHQTLSRNRVGFQRAVFRDSLLV
jgi:hypothetical protein